MNSFLARLKQPVFLWPLLVLIVVNGLMWVDLLVLRYSAAFLLLAFLPGWIWLQAVFRPPIPVGERILLAIGLSLTLTILATMFSVYWPGPLVASQLLIVINLLSITGLTVMIVSKKPPLEVTSGPQLTAIILLLVILLLAAALRLPRLGYAEFHEDEAEALMLGTRLLQGEDYALFLHRKGPAQMLLPMAFWLTTGRITESLARFPFALSSLLGVATLFFIGGRWFGWPAGGVAGLLAAINGYSIAFGRMVQYQALILLLGPLALYSLYLGWKYHRPRLQILAALLLAVCLLAHFDALLLLPAAGYLFWLTVKRMADEGGTTFSPRTRFTIPAIALLLFLALLAAFYIPYLFDPEFQNTASYLSQNRVKPGLLYNNLNLLQRLDRDYSSHFHLPLLALGVIAAALKFPTGKRRWAVAGLGLLLASTMWLPDLWRIGRLNLALLPWLVGLTAVGLSARSEARAAWVMFGAAFIGYVFLVDDPRTHLYIFYPGAALLAGAGWLWLGQSTRPRLSLLLLGLGLLLAGAVIIYQSAIFLRTESALTNLHQKWNRSIWETLYDDLPKARGYFGYPKREGWKVIGALRAQGRFPGDFRSVNEDFIVPIWYSYGQARSCYETPDHYFVRTTGLDDLPLLYEQYTEVGQVEREEEVRLRLFSANSPASTQQPAIYRLAAVEDEFDHLATPPQFARQREPGRRLETQFGPAIRLVGYDLPTAAVAPGDRLTVNLYWQALENPGDNYRAFVHLTDGNTLWGQQDEDPACRLPTSIWRAGQRGRGQFRLQIDPATPPGRYPLIIGLYQAESLERLKITAGAGQVGDDFLWLGDIEVVEK